MVMIVVVIVIVFFQQVFRCARQYPVAPGSWVDCIKEQITLRFVAQKVLCDEEGQTWFRYVFKAESPRVSNDGIE